MDFALQCQELGAGEFLLQNVEADGSLEGPDFKTLELLVKEVHVPIIVSGGISDTRQIYDLYNSENKSLGRAAVQQLDLSKKLKAMKEQKQKIVKSAALLGGYNGNKKDTKKSRRSR